MTTLRCVSQLSTYRNFSSGENARPFGPFRSFANQRARAPSRTRNTPLNGEFLARIVVELRQAERRVGEIEAAVAAVDEVVRAVEPLALDSGPRAPSCWPLASRRMTRRLPCSSIVRRPCGSSVSPFEPG